VQRLLAMAALSLAPVMARAQALHGVKKVLLFDVENGHGDVKQNLRTTLTAMAKDKGFDLDTADGPTLNLMSYASLKNYQVVVWGSNEGGDAVLSPGTMQDGFQKWVEEGGGYIAYHSGTGAGCYSWEWQWSMMIQGYERDQGQGINAQAYVYGPSAPEYNLYPLSKPVENMLKGMPDPGILSDEWYSFKKDPRKVVRMESEEPARFKPEWGAASYGLHKVWVLLWTDADTWNRAGKITPSVYIGKFHPAAWAHMTGKGATVQMSFGHQVNPSIFTQSNGFGKELLWRSIRWAAKDPGYWDTAGVSTRPIEMRTGSSALAQPMDLLSGPGQVTVSFHGNRSHAFTVRDTRGKVAYRGRGAGERDYDLSFLERGMYHLEARAGRTKLARQFLKF
jgi:type 1 glutamine amidotransferase